MPDPRRRRSLPRFPSGGDTQATTSLYRCREVYAARSPALDAAADSLAVAARNRTLHLSTIALATWRMHQGNRQVIAYRAAARAATGETC